MSLYTLQQIVVPGGRYTSPFGMRVNPVTGNYELHDGFDLAPPVPGQRGVMVHCPCDGTIRSITNDAGGHGVTIWDAGNLEHYWFMCHFARRVPWEVGQAIRYGQAVGEMGDTGMAKGIHLHASYRVMQPGGGFKALDPVVQFMTWSAPTSATLGDTRERYLAVMPLGYTEISARQTAAIIDKQPSGNGDYTSDDIYLIVDAYNDVCKKVDLDPRVVLAQSMVHTNYLAAPAAARPRRNPADIGDLSFATWAEHAIPAHVGRLLAYALAPDQGSVSQRAIIASALALRPLPAELRGKVARVADLGNGVWSARADYANTIADMCVTLFD